MINKYGLNVFPCSSPATMSNVWSQRPWRNRQIILLPQGFLHNFKNSTIVKIYDVVDQFLRKPFWFFRSIFSILGSMDVKVMARSFLANLRSSFLVKGRMHPFVHLSIVFWLYTALQCRSSMSSNCLDFHASWDISSSPAAFLFLIFLCTESSSSCVNCASLMSNCLILVICSCVSSGGFPSKFSKSCFHSCIRSS